MIIERDGQELAAIVPIEEYRRLRAQQEQESETEDEELRTFFEDRKTFLRRLPELLRTHAGQFVAIFQGELVDADPELSALAKRVYEKYGYQAIYMDEVLETPRVYEFPSPEISR